MVTLGSLFDGSGGFPLAGMLNGITPVWASEIEPYPLKVTAVRFPHMKQYGDITKMNGHDIEPVDIISFGSPCQDLSVAGKQAGLHDGERSSLFFHAIRIIKEMREATNGKYPRFAVWENVPGAFSSNQKHDFAAVLEALASVCEDGISVPVPEKWKHAGCVVGDEWSIAWRVYDAQYWGVPQRRKRIYLIADFGSERAGEILFESESVSGDTEQGTEEREDSAGDSAESTGETGHGSIMDAYQHWGWRENDTCGTLTAGQNNSVRGDTPLVLNEPAVVYGIGAFNSNAMLSDNPNSGIYEADTSRTLDLNGGNPACNQGGMVVCVGNGQTNQSVSDKAGTLNCMHDQQAVMIRAVDGYNGAISDEQSTLGVNCGLSTGRNAVLYEMQHASDVIRENKDVSPTLQHRMGTGGNNVPLTLQTEEPAYIVRRLTPLECCRLQGFPDWWEEGVNGSDTARYKMWGNGIALPCARDVLRRIVKELK